MIGLDVAITIGAWVFAWMVFSLVMWVVRYAEIVRWREAGIEVDFLIPMPVMIFLIGFFTLSIGALSILT